MGKPAQSRSVPTELPPPKRPRPAPAQSSSYQTPAVDDDDIQEVVPVKSEPGGGIAADNSGYVGDQGAGAVALDDPYADENYDYGAYGEAGYDDGSGMIDPNTGLPLAGADGNKELDRVIESCMGKNKEMGTWNCTQCGYSSIVKTDVINHIEAKHIESSVNCDLCGITTKTRKALKMHKSRHHRFNL